MTTTFVPFTRINGLSNRRRYPIIGKIRLGIRALGKSGSYPVETPYFVVPKEVQELYGEKPTELDVMFPSNNPELIFPQSLRWYGNSHGLKCIGNKKQAQRLDERTFRFEPRECPCELLEKGECSERAQLLVMLPRISMAGLYQIDLGSSNSMIDINSYFDWMNTHIGRFAMIQLKLRRVPRHMVHKGQPRIHYPLALRFDGSAADIEELKKLNAEILSKLGSIEVQEPEDTNPAIDPQATTVLEHDLPKALSLNGPGSEQAESATSEPPATSDPTRPVEQADQSPSAAPDTPAAPQMTEPQKRRILRKAKEAGLAEDLILAKIHHLTKKEASALISRLDRQDHSFFDAAAPATAPALSGPRSEVLEPRANATLKANERLTPLTRVQFKTSGDATAFDQAADGEAPVADGGGVPPFLPTTEGVEF
ncbi:hypothetical protein [Nitrospira defluvii]|uniref:Bacteriophage T4 Gp32 single-stranded DNA-binding domain-containing protein n=1 Tax=Nitrospira defluvii TaxID=330214 RepID=A0ABM8R5J4_9BACT|nr:hypothetical protein [Nitrospira defluvii]CAE6734158.1 conserved hypothetical protein [Nitrospira defluvii]